MKTFETTNPISVEIEVAAGSVHLIASDRSDTTVVVNPTEQSRKADREAAEKTSIEFSGERLTVKTSKSSGIGRYIDFTMTGSVEVTIELPDQSSLDVSTGFGDVNADGQFGEINAKSGAGAIHVDHAKDVRLSSGAGDLSVNRCRGEINAKSGAGAIHVGEAKGVRLSSGAGNLSLNRCRGNAQITTAGEMKIARIDGHAEVKNLHGRTWVGVVEGRLRVRSANGDITVDQALSNVDMKTANGNITLGEVRSGEISLETAAGGLEVGIQEGSAAWIDVKTKFGRVHNSLEAAGAPNAEGGKVEVRARTSFGDIHIHRASPSEER